MSDRLTPAIVVKVARLARLDLTPAEIERRHRDNSVTCSTTSPTSMPSICPQVEPMNQPLPLVNVMRDDVVAPCLDRDEVLAAAPSTEDGRFWVPPIVGIEG